MQESSITYNHNNAVPFLDEVIRRSGQNLSSCYQCQKCAAGCPVSDQTEGVSPDKLIRMIIVGDTEAALSNQLIWKCLSCYTCGTRCPNGIQTGRITETIKKMAKERHVTALSPKVKHFHDSFVRSGVRWGRLNEMEFMGIYQLKNTISDFIRKDIQSIKNEMLSQARLGLAMQKLKRLHVDFLRTIGRHEIKRLYKKAKQMTARGSSWK